MGQEGKPQAKEPFQVTKGISMFGECFQEVATCSLRRMSGKRAKAQGKKPHYRQHQGHWDQGWAGPGKTAGAASGIFESYPKEIWT